MSESDYADYEPPVLCLTCEYFVVDRDRKQRVSPTAHYSGECRRYPPDRCFDEPVPLGYEGYDRTKGRAPVRPLTRGWPIVSEIDWCGEAVKRQTD